MPEAQKVRRTEAGKILSPHNREESLSPHNRGVKRNLRLTRNLGGFRRSQGQKFAAWISAQRRPPRCSSPRCRRLRTRRKLKCFGRIKIAASPQRLVRQTARFPLLQNWQRNGHHAAVFGVEDNYHARDSRLLRNVGILPLEQRLGKIQLGLRTGTGCAHLLYGNDFHRLASQWLPFARERRDLLILDLERRPAGSWRLVLNLGRGNGMRSHGSFFREFETGAANPSPR